MTDTETEAVVEKLREMRAWADVSRGDEDGLAAVESAVRDVCRHDGDVVVAGVRRFVEEASEDGFDVSEMSKVFVVNRFLFDVPASAPLDQPRFGAFVGVPVEGDEVDELWPWEMDADGRLHLTGYFRGYTGETYQALAELEAFQSRYGPRE